MGVDLFLIFSQKKSRQLFFPNMPPLLNDAPHVTAHIGTTHYCTTTTTAYIYFKPRVAPRAREKNAFHVKGVGEIVNQTVKSDRAITPLLKT